MNRPCRGWWSVAVALSASVGGCASVPSSEAADASATPAPSLARSTADASVTAFALAGVSRAPPLAPALVSPTALHPPSAAERAAYSWLAPSSEVRRLKDAFPAPSGFARLDVADRSFGAWLRDLPLRAPGSPVKTFAGSILRESDDPRISAVAEIDVGSSDLQQCADSVIRLHAEWSWSEGDRQRIGYHFLSGEYAPWKRYAEGQRPSADGNKIVWKTSAKADQSRATFRRYLDVVFMYASTISLALHSEPVERKDITPGDFFVMPGGPGHTVLVLDIAQNDRGQRVALLGQGYMPAQDFQVLHPEGESAWFSLDGDSVVTPFWTPFPWSALHRLGKPAS